MGRKIKFRAWLKGEMCYDLAFEEYEPINDLLAGGEHLMQFTGLQDKNGKEICEGDVLRQHRDRGTAFEVRWDKDGLWFAVELPKAVVWRSPLWRWAQVTEVIGNIYENPELLKE